MIIDEELLYSAFKEYLRLYDEHDFYEAVLGGMLLWSFNCAKGDMQIKELKHIITMFSYFRRHKLVARSFFEEFINETDELLFE